MLARARLFLELALALSFGLACIATLIAPDWLERTWGWAGDGDSGAFERGLSWMLGIASVSFSLVARRDWRRIRAGWETSRAR